MDEDKMKELTEKFMKNFPVEFTALHGESRNNYHDIDMFHSYACHVAIDGFDYHREEKKEMPSLFLIPFERKLVTPRGNQFLNMGKEIEVFKTTTLTDLSQLCILGVVLQTYFPRI